MGAKAKRVLFVVLCWAGLFLQQAQACDLCDSLKVKLSKNTSTKDSFETIIQLSAGYLASDLNLSRKYADQALFMAQQKNWPLEIARSYIQISENLLSSGSLTIALEYVDKAIDLLLKYKDINQVAIAYTLKGRIKSATGKGQEALDYLYKGLNFYKSIFSRGLASVYWNIGEVHVKMGDYESAMNYYSLALSDGEASQDFASMANSYNAMGTLYEKLEKDTMALSYYKKSLYHAKLSKDSRMISVSMSSIGTYYLEKKIFRDSVLYYFQNALALNEERGSPADLIGAYIGLGKYYASERNPSKAIEYYNKAVAYADENIPQERLIEVYINAAKGYLELGNRNSALRLLNLAERKVSNELSGDLIMTYSNLAEAYELSGDYRKALVYLRKYNSLYDSLLGIKRTEQIEEMKDRFESTRKEIDLKRIQAENREKEMHFTQYKQKVILIIGSLVILVAFFIIALVYFRFRDAKKLYNMLEQKNDSIEKQNILLEHKNKELKQYAYVVAHDLKAPLRTIGSYINLIQRRIKNLDDPELNEFMGYVSTGAKDLSGLLDDLLHYNSIKPEELKPQTIQPINLVQKVLHNLRSQIESIQAKVHINGLPSQLLGYESAFYQIFLNLVANALKFNNGTEVSIHISCKELENYYEFVVRDNGIGIAPDEVDQIFNLFKRLRPKEYEGTGIGLSIVQKSVEMHNGKIWVVSTQGKGSSFYFTIAKSI